MSKKLFQILSLIFSILALAYMCWVHYGFKRFFNIKNGETDQYFETYKKLDKASKDKVVIAFSVDENNMKNIKPFLNSILDQTVRVDDIAVTISSDEKTKIPENLKKLLNVHTFNKDYDDAGNLILSVLREPEANTKIIILEPNTVYGEDFIQTMIEESDKYPDMIIYGDKQNKKQAILVKPKFFDENLAEYKKGEGCCIWLDKCSRVSSKSISYNRNFKI